ncbi:3'(2'),5'-bisphosphate nucleotidase CysQ [Kovacikia minuta CCNUW1]|nr:3'(2'),5'-bisphosphate nucleotidase CysQ [Kovacikia minuta CCNUW1]
MQDQDLQELVTIARSIGWGTASILLEMQHTELGVEDAGDGPVTKADKAANRYILDNLQAALGTAEFGYLSEENYKTQNHERSSQPWVWVIDPLDGTKDFIQGTGEFSVHIALLHVDRPVVSVVVCPAAATLYFATLHGGTFAEKQDGSIKPVKVSQRQRLEDLTIVASRSHRNERLKQLLQRFPCQKQRSVGSVGGKIAAILEQTAEVYISLSGQSAPKDWDLAAPELILTEAGGQFTYFDGTLLQYNQADVSKWGGLLASNGSCHQALCTAAVEILAEIDAQ